MTDTKMIDTKIHWLSELEYACRKRGISCFCPRESWILGEQLTLGMRKDGRTRYVVYTPECDVDLTIAEIRRYMDELDPNGRKTEEDRA